MRYYIFFTLLSFLFQACVPGLSAPLATDTPTETVIPSQTSTFTPRRIFTPSPTIARFSTQDYDSSPTGIAIPVWTGYVSSTPFPTAAPVSTGTSSQPGEGFESVKLSENKIYWGVCSPNRTKVSAILKDPENVYNVAIFIRLRDEKELDYTPWKGTGMDDRTNGLWTYLIRANSIKERRNYSKSWIQYQLVATDKDGIIIGRTQIYFSSIALLPCP